MVNSKSQKAIIKSLDKQGIGIVSLDPGEWTIYVDETAKVRNETFESLGDLRDVVTLQFLDEFAVTDAMLEICIKHCQKLRALSVGNASRLSKGILHELGQLTCLRHLTLLEINFPLSALFDSKISKELRDLNLWRTSLSDAMIGKLVEAFPKLGRLNAEYTKLGPKGIKELARLKKLVGLELNGCKLRDDCFESLMEIKQLLFVALRNTKVTQAATEQFAKKRRKCCVAIGAGQSHKGALKSL